MLNFPDADNNYKNWQRSPPNVGPWVKTKVKKTGNAGGNLTGSSAVIPLDDTSRSFQLIITYLNFAAQAQPYLEMSNDGTTFGAEGQARWHCHYSSPTGGPSASLGAATGVSSRGALLGASLMTPDANSHCHCVIDINPGGGALIPVHQHLFLVSSQMHSGLATYYQMWMAAYHTPGPAARMKAVRIIGYSGAGAAVNISSGYWTLLAFP